MEVQKALGTVFVACVLMVGLGPQAIADEAVQDCGGGPTGLVGVVPEEVSYTGSESVVCANLGFDFAWKIDDWDAGISGPHTSDDATPTFQNTITIENNDGTCFDWSAAPHPLGAVLVKGGSAANLFGYDPAAPSDTVLYAPLNAGGNRPEISHVIFCWNRSDDKCYQEETAWAAGNRYTVRGSWAMFVPYAGVAKTVDIMAGQHHLAGTATFSAVDDGQVTITINLAPGFIFYYDLNGDDDDHNLKVQDYATAPSGNPQIGKFDHKQAVPVGSTSAVITVPANNFYGVHLDVAREVECEE